MARVILLVVAGAFGTVTELVASPRIRFGRIQLLKSIAEWYKPQTYPLMSSNVAEKSSINGGLELGE